MTKFMQSVADQVVESADRDLDRLIDCGEDQLRIDHAIREPIEENACGLASPQNVEVVELVASAFEHTFKGCCDPTLCVYTEHMPSIIWLRMI